MQSKTKEKSITPALLKTVENAADSILAYYKQAQGIDGVLGAGEFIQAAATWSYDHIDRPAQRPQIKRM